ncbi:tyrosine-type recombinase/integrase [Streptomyces amritsarensis]|uniref:tyrosine-type recombinase/integrase n=1 Tax=Streptomyces amritsarensis TaxID=681158 RepID=UPI001F0A3F6B|nr:tyrosine-type recombinase/integrase [Streptomyces amritsarensis]
MTKPLLFPGLRGSFVRVSHFNDHMWKPALAVAGIIPPADDGERHASAPQHGMHALRHFYASVLLDAGENIRALSQYLGHADPGFTLRTYTHLCPAARAGPETPSTACFPSLRFMVTIPRPPSELLRVVHDRVMGPGRDGSTARSASAR